MNALRRRLVRWQHQRTFKGAAPGPYAIHVTKDLRVPMDDGTQLLADLISPVGDTDPRLPTIVIRGPYGRRGGVDRFASALAREGFVVLFQSCRGTAGSEGAFDPQVDEQEDGIATHRWVRRQPWFTGTVATFGESYMGYTQWAVAGRLQREDPQNAPDALCLLITMPDFGAVTWDNGAFSLRNALGWTQMVDRLIRKEYLPLVLAMLRPDPRLAKAFDVLPLSAGDLAATGRAISWYQDWTRQERLTDEFWTQQSHTASVPDVTAPTFMVSGWYDIFLPWQLRTYEQLAAAGRPPRLTLGPWGHVSPGLNAPALQESVAFLKEHFAETPSERVAPVRAYRTGAGTWHDLPAWPPPGATEQTWYLYHRGGLDPALPDGGASQYVFDPAEPTPALGGPSLEKDSGPVDNSAHEARADVLVFRSDELEQPVTLAGVPRAAIRFRSSRPSADVFVRICDVYPDGRSMTVCDAIRRLGTPGTVDTDPEPDAAGFRDVEISLWPTFHEFAAEHRISIQISSGAHPRYARNPGSGEPAASADITFTALQEISHESALPSRIVLPIWPEPAGYHSIALGRGGSA